MTSGIRMVRVNTSAGVCPVEYLNSTRIDIAANKSKEYPMARPNIQIAFEYDLNV